MVKCIQIRLVIFSVQSRVTREGKRKMKIRKRKEEIMRITIIMGLLIINIIIKSYIISIIRNNKYDINI
jgi:anti-anti-sigma regulatory factor